VQFDDGEICVVASNISCIEQASASLPPRECLPPLPLISQQKGEGEQDADAAPLADEEAVEDELGDPNREEGEKNLRRKRGKMLRMPN
jgi:hypothetical protein